MNQIYIYKYLEQVVFRYGTKGAKVRTSIKKADKIVYGFEEYSLVGFTMHQGLDAESGHYVAYNSETSMKFDDLGGNQRDKYGNILPPDNDFVPGDQLAIAQEKGYIYLYKKITDR